MRRDDVDAAAWWLLFCGAAALWVLQVVTATQLRECRLQPCGCAAPAVDRGGSDWAAEWEGAQR